MTFTNPILVSSNIARILFQIPFRNVDTDDRITMAQNLPTFWCLNSRKTSSLNNVAIRTTVKPDDASTEKNAKQRKAFDEQGMFDKSQSPPSLFW